MNLQKRIEQALKEAIREKNENKRNAIRLLLTALKVKEKELKRLPTETEIQQLIGAQIKQRKESAEQFSRANRQDLVAKEEIERFVTQVRADGYLVLRGISREQDSFSDGLGHLHDFEISTFRLTEQAPLTGKSLAQVELRKKYGVTVLAIRRDSQMLPNPEPDMQLLAGDLLIVMGTPDNLSKSSWLFKKPEAGTLPFTQV